MKHINILFLLTALSISAFSCTREIYDTASQNGTIRPELTVMDIEPTAVDFECTFSDNSDLKRTAAIRYTDFTSGFASRGFTFSGKTDYTITDLKPGTYYSFTLVVRDGSRIIESIPAAVWTDDSKTETK